MTGASKWWEDPETYKVSFGIWCLPNCRCSSIFFSCWKYSLWALALQGQWCYWYNDGLHRCMVCRGGWPWSMKKLWDPSGSAARPSSSRWNVGGSAAKVRGCKCWRNRQRDSFGAYDLKVCTEIIVSVQWDEARFCIFVSYYHSIIIASAIYALIVVSCLCCCLLDILPLQGCATSRQTRLFFRNRGLLWWQNLDCLQCCGLSLWLSDNQGSMLPCTTYCGLTVGQEFWMCTL